MKLFLVISTILALTSGRPDGLPDGDDGHVSVTQSSLGTYKYTVELKDSFRSEERLEDGTVIGEYIVPDANGLPQTIKYTSGRDGFRILEGPLPVAPVDNLVPVVALPVAVEDTPEVRAAREEFLALYRAAAVANEV